MHDLKLINQTHFVCSFNWKHGNSPCHMALCIHGIPNNSPVLYLTLRCTLHKDKHSTVLHPLKCSMIKHQKDCLLHASCTNMPGAYHVRIISGHLRSERPALLQRMATQQALPQLHIPCLPTARLLVLRCCLTQQPFLAQGSCGHATGHNHIHYTNSKCRNNNKT